MTKPPVEAPVSRLSDFISCLSQTIIYVCSQHREHTQRSNFASRNLNPQTSTYGGRFNCSPLRGVTLTTGSEGRCEKEEMENNLPVPFRNGALLPQLERIISREFFRPAAVPHIPSPGLEAGEAAASYCFIGLGIIGRKLGARE